MRLLYYISRRIKSDSAMATLSVAVSFFVMVLAMVLSSGFQVSVRDAVRALSGDIVITSPYMDMTSSEHPVYMSQGVLDSIESVSGKCNTVVYRAGIAKSDSAMAGAVFKGISGKYSFEAFERQLSDGIFPRFDSLKISSDVAIPRALADELEVGVGDRISAYYVGDRVLARKFSVCGIYESVMNESQGLVVFADIRNLQRLNGWEDFEYSAVEVMSDGDIFQSLDAVRRVLATAPEDECSSVVAMDTESRYPGLFDWLRLLDFNLYIILILMFVVSGFNMVSGILIILFENISMIGLLKALGMRNGRVVKVFLAKASSIVLKGLVAGNAAALVVALVQKYTGLVKLDPSNYILNVVPVHFDVLSLVLLNVVAYLLIMCVMLVPSLFVSRVDPAKTVKML